MNSDQAKIVQTSFNMHMINCIRQARHEAITTTIGTYHSLVLVLTLLQLTVRLPSRYCDEFPSRLMAKIACKYPSINTLHHRKYAYIDWRRWVKRVVDLCRLSVRPLLSHLLMQPLLFLLHSFILPAIFSLLNTPSKLHNLFAFFPVLLFLLPRHLLNYYYILHPSTAFTAAKSPENEYINFSPNCCTLKRKHIFGTQVLADSSKNTAKKQTKHIKFEVACGWE